MTRVAALLLFSCLISMPVMAADPASDCKKVPELVTRGWPQHEPDKCDCGSDITRKYDIKAVPAGLSLVATCGYSKVKHGSGIEEVYGAFYFRGDATISGEITHNQYVAGMNLLFVGPRTGRYEGFADSLRVMKFIDEKTALKAFKAPKLNDRDMCWKANTTLRVMSLLVIRGGGDEAGSYSLKYEVPQVGSYKSCEPEA